MKYKLRIALVAVAGLLAVPLLAAAADWPAAGGDAGRSGHQAVDAAAVDSTTAPAFPPVDDAGVPRGSIVTAAGDGSADPVLAYGQFLDVGAGGSDDDETRVHIRDLATGQERVPDDEQLIDAAAGAGDDDVLGTAAAAVAPVAMVSSAGRGHLLVVHNDDNSLAQAPGCPLGGTGASANDIAIAHFDLATGHKVADFAVGPPQAVCAGDQVASGYRIESPPVITPPLDASGRRALVFVAARSGGGGQPRLFRIGVEDAGSAGLHIEWASPEFLDVPGLNTLAGPSIAYLPGASGVSPHIIVPAGSGSTVRSFSVDGLEPGPSAPGGIAGTPRTVSVPVARNGLLPGEPGSGAAMAPSLFAAYDNGDGTTTVRKFLPDPADGALEVAPGSKAVSLEGSPSHSLAVTETVEPATGAVTRGRVVVATGANLIVLDSGTLEVVDRFSDVNAADGPEAPLSPGTTGFSRNSPTVSGAHVFIAADDGRQHVLALADGEPVPAGDFTEDAANAGSAFAIGQPAYSRGHLQFMSDRGLFVYRVGIVPVPPVPDYAIEPNPAAVGEEVGFDAGASADPDGRIVSYEWDLDGDGTFETATETAEASRSYDVDGIVRTQLRVTDDRGNAATLAKDLVVSSGGNRPPTASLAVLPSSARVAQRVLFDARASGDPDGSIVRHEWDLDGNGTFERNSGTKPTISRTYGTPGVRNVRLRVTDDGGAGTEVARQLVVVQAGRARARRLTARVSPSRDSFLPYRFTTRGRLVRPPDVARRDACRGRVTVTVKRGRRTVSRRTTRLRRSCRYSDTLTLHSRERLGRARRLRFKARFQGNAAVLPRTARTRRARIG